MAASPSVASEPPPNVAGQPIAADRLLPSSHPLWRLSAGKGTFPSPFVGKGGRGRGRGRGGAGSVQGDDAVAASIRLEPLSALGLEYTAFCNADGSEPSVVSDTASVTRGPFRRNSMVTKTCPYSKKKTRSLFSQNLATAAFGVTANTLGLQRPAESSAEDAENDEDDEDDEHADDNEDDVSDEDNNDDEHDEDDDARSATPSSQHTNAICATYPVRGVTCVGCLFGDAIAPVESFVVNNFARMEETSLFKLAALVYKRDVQEPRAKEGVRIPRFGWRDARTHFLLHSTNEQISRAATVRQLQTMRLVVSQRLVRNENGERDLDQRACDLTLKLVKSESEQRALLAAAVANAAKSKSNQSTVATI
jgi:hypothetical protein